MTIKELRQANNMKKVISIALTSVLSLCLLVGCGGGSESSTSTDSVSKAESRPSAGSGETGSVYWLNYKPESDEVLQDVAKMYKEAAGVDVKIVTAASGTYNQTLISEMNKSNPPTIFVIGNQASAKEWTDYALDLKGTEIEKELNTDEYNIYDENGKLVSIGYCYECYGIIVNPDLIDQAGYTMDDLVGFDGLKMVAEDIHARAADLGFDAFSACDMDSSSSWRFTSHLANLEYFYEERDDGGWTECPSSIKGTYMENYKNLYDLCINNSTVAPTTLAAGGHDSEAEFKEGKAAFFVNGSWEYGAVSENVPDAAMIPYYCGVAGEEKAGLNCGTENCWAINCKASEADQKATMDFLVWCVTDPDASRMLVDSFGAMPYRGAAESTNEFLATADDYSNNGCYVMDWAANYQPNVDQYRANLAAALNQYNADQSDANWDSVKTAFVDGWAAQYKAVNG